MQLNCTTDKLETLLSVVRASSRKEGQKADLVREGTFDLALTWLWVTHLAESAEYVDVKARTAGVRLMAKQTLHELAPLVVAGAEHGDPFLKVWEFSARRFVGRDSKLPHLRIVPEPPLRRLDGRPL